MTNNYLRQVKSAAANIARPLFGSDPDAIEKVIGFIEERFPRIYTAAVAERGRGTVHRQIGKAVKHSLGAENDGRRVSSPHVPCKTHQRLKSA